MKFAHLADVHIGGWRDPLLKDASTKAFSIIVSTCLEELVDFVIIAGDLFNTSLPPMDCLKIVVSELKRLSDVSIPVYMVPGSHDFSPTGKTMLDVLENAGLIINVARADIVADKLRLRITKDKKTGVILAGMPGRKGGLESEYYKHLDASLLEKAEGYKIFVFHSAIAELKPEEMALMEADPVSNLPKGCNYYAGGHVHVVCHATLEGYAQIVYPGPLFPNSFSELEKLEHGGFYLVTDDKATFIPIIVHPVQSIVIHAENKTPLAIEDELTKNVTDVTHKIVLIRIEGTLLSGKPSEIRWKTILTMFIQRGAFIVLRNTAKLLAKEFDAVRTQSGDIEQIESRIIEENVGASGLITPQLEKELMKTLLHVLSHDKGDGESVSTFEERIIGESETVTQNIFTK